LPSESKKDESDEVLTIEELSDYLKISKSSLYKLVQDGNLPGLKIGRHWRFQKAVIDQWMKDKTNLPLPEKGGASV
jgi:excisionase family DNA binding protein